MSYVFFDDSKHEHRGHFCLGALVFFKHDPQQIVHDALVRNGLTPGIDEFKSSYRMAGNVQRQRLRDEFKRVLGGAGIGVVVAPRATDLGVGGLELLAKATKHPSLKGACHRVYFDEGLFRSQSSGLRIAARMPELSSIDFYPEQSSVQIAGIQLADLAAHSCGIILLESLGLVTKTIKAGDDSGYDPELKINLGFELWAGLRYSFLAEPPPPIDDWDTAEDQPQPIANVKPYGLHLVDGVADEVRSAALDTFGTMYYGCTH